LIKRGHILLPYFCGKNHPVESYVALRIGLDVMEEEVILFGKVGLRGESVGQLPKGPKTINGAISHSNNQKFGVRKLRFSHAQQFIP
jgi:hypothetical protein